MPTLIEGFVNGQRYEIEYPDDISQETITRATQEFFESLPLVGVPGSPFDLFETAAEFTSINEGGYSADPDDPGGVTKFGISQRAFPEVDIVNLTLQDAKDIYRDTYWEKSRFNEIPYDELAVKVFDAGINMGTNAAGKLLQRAVNDLTPEQEDKVTVDGKVGSKTLAATVKHDRKELADAFVRRMKKRYGDIVNTRSSSAKFLRGWIRRAERMPGT